MHVVMQDIDHRNLLRAAATNNESAVARDRVAHPHALQMERYHSPAKPNANMINTDTKEHARLNTDAKSILDTAAERLNISACSYMKVVKAAGTIADLDASPTIEVRHITEALQYRRQE